jgi:hypothetical protein
MILHWIGEAIAAAISGGLLALVVIVAMTLWSVGRRHR